MCVDVSRLAAGGTDCTHRKKGNRGKSGAAESKSHCILCARYFAPPSHHISLGPRASLKVLEVIPLSSAAAAACCCFFFSCCFFTGGLTFHLAALATIAFVEPCLPNPKVPPSAPFPPPCVPRPVKSTLPTGIRASATMDCTIPKHASTSNALGLHITAPLAPSKLHMAPRAAALTPGLFPPQPLLLSGKQQWFFKVLAFLKANVKQQSCCQCRLSSEVFRIS